MMWTRRRIVIAAVGVVAVAGLVIGLLLALGGGQQAETTSAAPRVRSPFTGELVPSLNRVLAVKSTPSSMRGRRPGSLTLTSSTCSPSKAD